MRQSVDFHRTLCDRQACPQHKGKNYKEPWTKWATVLELLGQFLGTWVVHVTLKLQFVTAISNGKFFSEKLNPQIQVSHL